MSERLNITEFRVLGEHIRKACGLHLADDKHSRVAKIISSRMSELEIACFSEYERLLASSPERSGELTTLAALLTVGETYFFRNQAHWQALEECVLPWILERSAATGQRRLRIWSAGCSTGEEAYTAAIVLNRSLPDLAHWSIEVIGTDLNPAAVAGARRAVYTQHSFRDVPPEIKTEYFEPVEAGRYRLRADIRDMVRFQELNLLDNTAMARMGDVDVIFCRNVLIYFDASGVARVMAHLHRSLRSDGHLFLGHAESAHGTSSGFASVNVCNTFLYRSVPYAARVSRPIDTSPRLDRDTGETPRREAPTVREVVATPEPPSLDDPRARAMDHVHADENTEARKVLDEILRRKPGDSESLLGIALLSAGSGNTEAALRCCERVLKTQPMSAEAYCVMALVHEGLHENSTAQREFEKAIYLDDGFSIAHFRLARLHNRAQRQDAAMREFSNALNALPADDEQRVRLYSGGFSKEIVAGVCERWLGIESAAVVSEGKCE